MHAQTFKQIAECKLVTQKVDELHASQAAESSRGDSAEEEAAGFLQYLLAQKSLSPEEANSHAVDLMMGAVETVSAQSFLSIDPRKEGNAQTTADPLRQTQLVGQTACVKINERKIEEAWSSWTASSSCSATHGVHTTYSGTMSFEFGSLLQTSNSCLWLLYCLAWNPEVQRALRREADAVLGDADVVTPAMIARLPYIKACLRETFR